MDNQRGTYVVGPWFSAFQEQQVYALEDLNWRMLEFRDIGQSEVSTKARTKNRDSESGYRAMALSALSPLPTVSSEL